MNKQVRDLVDELQRLVILEHHLLLILLLILLPLLIRLPLINLKLLPLRVLTQLQQKLRLLLQKLKQLNIVVPDIQLRSLWGSLLTLVDLFYQSIDRFASLDGHVLVLF